MLVFLLLLMDVIGWLAAGTASGDVLSGILDLIDFVVLGFIAANGKYFLIFLTIFTAVLLVFFGDDVKRDNV